MSSALLWLVIFQIFRSERDHVRPHSQRRNAVASVETQVLVAQECCLDVRRSKRPCEICFECDASRPGEMARNEKNRLVVETARGIGSAYGVIGEECRRYEPLSSVVHRHQHATVASGEASDLAPRIP